MEKLTTADTYFLKALDNYDYNNMEEAIENMEYALGYDPEHAPAWCLKGRMLMDQFKRFEAAKKCFEMAILFDPNYVETYKHYTLLLIWMSDFKRAQIIVNKSKRVKGMSMATVILRSAMIHEYQGNIGEAIRIAKKGRLFSLTQTNYDFFNGEVNRLKKKIRKPVIKERKKEIVKAVKPTLLKIASNAITRLF